MVVVVANVTNDACYYSVGGGGDPGDGYNSHDGAAGGATIFNGTVAGGGAE